jgi:hypothetical protein
LVLAVTEELHAKQQEAARKEAERAARKAPQDAAADAKGEAGEPASKKGSTARSSLKRWQRRRRSCSATASLWIRIPTINQVSGSLMPGP